MQNKIKKKNKRRKILGKNRKFRKRKKKEKRKKNKVFKEAIFNCNYISYKLNITSPVFKLHYIDHFFPYKMLFHW